MCESVVEDLNVDVSVGRRPAACLSVYSLKLPAQPSHWDSRLRRILPTSNYPNYGNLVITRVRRFHVSAARDTTVWIRATALIPSVQGE